MIEVTAYNNPNAPEYRRWIAYAVMSNGQLWGVYATSSSEDEAKSKIAKLWESERAKVASSQIAPDYKPAPKPAIPAQPTSWTDLASDIKTDNRGHHSAGLVWLINKADRTKCRVSAENAEAMLASGQWERGGPRSK